MPRRIPSLTSLAAVILLLAACAGAEKLGDRAAAVGDWKSAEREYGQALQSDPGDPAKKAKYQEARQKALAGALASADACQVAQDWECAYREADYAYRLEPGNSRIAALRAGAGRNVAFVRVRGAQEASARGDHRAAFDLLGGARAASSDPAVQAEIARASAPVVAAAVRDAQQQRAAQQYPAAIDLLTLAAGVDGRVRPTLDQVRAEYDVWRAQQYEAEARQGDDLLRARRFAEAQAHYEAAQRYEKGGRAEPLGRYARGLAQGELAVQRRDWARATAAYEDAVRSGMDAGQLAATELDRVRIRPYAIRVRTALVKPFRPDGSPWAGGRSAGYERLVGMLAGAALDRSGVTGRLVLDVYDALPVENRPDLYAVIALPGGREFVTPPQKALRARLESFVVVNGNAYDDRPVTLRILHADRAGPVELGAVTVRLAEALRGELVLADRSVVEVRVTAEPSPLADGQSQGFAPVPAARR